LCRKGSAIDQFALKAVDSGFIRSHAETRVASPWPYLRHFCRIHELSAQCCGREIDRVGIRDQYPVPQDLSLLELTRKAKPGLVNRCIAGGRQVATVPKNVLEFLGIHSKTATRVARRFAVFDSLSHLT